MTQNLQTDQKIICPVNSSEMWLKLPWKTLSKETRRLQRRIYKASRNNLLLSQKQEPHLKSNHLLVFRWEAYPTQQVFVR